MKQAVSVVKVEDYAFDNVYNGVSKAIDLLGGIEKFISPGKKILLKPNLLSSYKPEQAITTHPEFVRALIRILKKLNCRIFLGDGPSAWVGNKRDVEEVYKITGMFDLCRQENVELVRFDEVFFINDIPITKWVNDCDYIISLPKFKTHDLTILTGAVKNLFGLIPGIFKAELHRRFPHPDDFSKILITIAENIKPALTIVDGVLALEGEGPATSGRPKNLGLIFASDNVFSLDCVLAKVMGIEAKDIPTLAAGKKYLDMDIEIMGDEVRNEKFLLPSISLTKKVPKFLFPIIQQIFYFRVLAKEYKCTFCKRCFKVCPADAVVLNETKRNISIDQKKCIQCFCCREACPVNDIEIEKSFGFRLLEMLYKLKSKK